MSVLSAIANMKDMKCWYCKALTRMSYEDIFYPSSYPNTCHNCSKYLLTCNDIEARGKDITLIHDIVCSECLNVSDERYDCNINSTQCKCNYSDLCTCCKVCKNLVSVRVDTIRSEKCTRCSNYVVFIYKQYLICQHISYIHDCLLRDININRCEHLAISSLY